MRQSVAQHPFAHVAPADVLPVATWVPVGKGVACKRVFPRGGRSAVPGGPRRRILDALKQEPGCNVNRVCQYLENDIGHLAIMKHLATLETAGLVIAETSGRERLLWFDPTPIQWIHERWTTEFSAWLHTTGLAPGGRMQMRTGSGKHVLVVGEVLEIDPPHRFVHSHRFTQYDDPVCQVASELKVRAAQAHSPRTLAAVTTFYIHQGDHHG